MMMDSRMWCFLACSLMFLNYSATRPASGGVMTGKLTPCSGSPNCVSSQSSDKAHYAEPLRYPGAMADAKATLLAVLQSMQRVRIVADQETYLHAEVRSFVFRFVDDVEFLFDDATQTIHLRSAARTGSSDFGVNRKRIEAIRAKFNQDVGFRQTSTPRP
jgi:uncharacterized protein (DUF1499 family)